MAKDKIFIDESVNQGAIFSYVAPKVLWSVQIPAGGEFRINYTKNISWWARLWMRFIGWKVTKVA